MGIRRKSTDIINIHSISFIKARKFPCWKMIYMQGMIMHPVMDVNGQCGHPKYRCDGFTAIQ